MKLYIDLKSKAVSASATELFAYPSFYAGDNVFLEIYCSMSKFEEGDSLKLAIGNIQKSIIYAYAEDFTISESGLASGYLDLNTSNLWQLFKNRNYIDSLAISIERTRDDSATLIGQAPCIVHKGLIPAADMSVLNDSLESISLKAYDDEGNIIDGKSVEIKGKITNNIATISFSQK